MEDSGNGSNLHLNSDMSNRAREIFYKIIRFEADERVKGVFIGRFPSSSGTNDVSGESIDSEPVSQRHLIMK
jgi:hypothetical protein